VKKVLLLIVLIILCIGCPMKVERPSMTVRQSISNKDRYDVYRECLEGRLFYIYESVGDVGNIIQVIGDDGKTAKCE
jgi:hypothetical protein